MRCAGSCANDELVFGELGYETTRVGRLMLPVRVENQYEFTACVANTGFDGGAVALVIWMPHDPRPGSILLPPPPPRGLALNYRF